MEREGRRGKTRKEERETGDEEDEGRRLREKKRENGVGPYLRPYKSGLDL